MRRKYTIKTMGKSDAQNYQIQQIKQAFYENKVVCFQNIDCVGCGSL